MPTPFLSIVIPCLDAVSWIDETLASVQRELEGTSFEIVVADGGSTDGTRERLRDAGVLLLEEPDNSLYEGVNRAVAAASGEYVLWLNADDVLCEGAADLVRRAEAGEWDFLTADARITGTDGRQRRISNGASRMSVESVLFGVASINSRVFSRRFLNAAGPFRTDLGLGADREMLLRLHRAGGRRCHLPVCAYGYRSHDRSRSLAGDWFSYGRVHEANLALAESLLREEMYTANRGVLKAFAGLSALALSRAELRSGRPRASLRALAHMRAYAASVRAGLALRARFKGKGSGW